MSETAPFFIVGTERSGSNLLRAILDAHPAIAIPHPPHLLKELGPLEPRYGDLRDDRNFERLVGDAVRLVELHFSPWDVALDRREVFAKAPARGVYGAQAAIYDRYREAKGKSRWGCKSTFAIHYVDRIRAVHPGAKFIHLVRDGRDVAVSARASVFNHFHPYYVARLWSRQQRLAMDCASRLSPDAMLTVRYEDLLDDPEAATRAVCRFLGEDYFDSMLRYFEAPETRRLAGLSRSWENVARPVIKSNRGKYKTALSKEEIAVFEREAFRELEAFGYPLENPKPELEAAGSRPRLRYWLEEKALAAQSAVGSLFSDRNSLAFLRKRLFVLKLKLSLPR